MRLSAKGQIVRRQSRKQAGHHTSVDGEETTTTGVGWSFRCSYVAQHSHDVSRTRVDAKAHVACILTAASGMLGLKSFESVVESWSEAVTFPSVWLVVPSKRNQELDQAARGRATRMT